MGALCCREATYSFDWKTIDDAPSPALTEKQKESVKKVFRLLKTLKVFDKLVVGVFEELFITYPGVLNYFKALSNPSCNSFNADGHHVTEKLVKKCGRPAQQKLVDAAVRNENFIGHMKEVAASLSMLVGTLDNDEVFNHNCSELEIFHSKLPGIDRIFFKEMMESIDKAIYNILGNTSYSNDDRWAVIHFLTTVYCLTFKSLPEKEINWTLIDVYAGSKAKQPRNSKFHIEHRASAYSGSSHLSSPK